MQGVYVVVAILAGAAAAGAGWLLGAPIWAVAGLYVVAGSLGVLLAALAPLLAPSRGPSRPARARSALRGSWLVGARVLEAKDHRWRPARAQPRHPSG